MSTAATEPNTVGYMPMPASFSRRSLFLAGRPRHQRNDNFWCRHPPMDRLHRAKIFAPFDALAGFDECIQAKEVLFEQKRSLSEDETADLDEKLCMLRALIYNSKVSGLNRPSAVITCFFPCSDPQNEWYEKGGQYKDVAGTVSKVDAVISMTVTVDDQVISFDDIYSIRINHIGQRSEPKKKQL